MGWKKFSYHLPILGKIEEEDNDVGVKQTFIIVGLSLCGQTKLTCAPKLSSDIIRAQSTW